MQQPVHEPLMTQEDFDRLDALERRMAAAWDETALALAEIKDTKLYRQTRDGEGQTWEQYCMRVHQEIMAESETTHSLSPLAVGHLERLEPQDQVEIVKAVQDGGEADCQGHRRVEAQEANGPVQAGREHPRRRHGGVTCQSLRKVSGHGRAYSCWALGTYMTVPNRSGRLTWRLFESAEPLPKFTARQNDPRRHPSYRPAIFLDGVRHGAEVKRAELVALLMQSGQAVDFGLALEKAHEVQDRMHSQKLEECHLELELCRKELHEYRRREAEDEMLRDLLRGDS